MNVLELSDTTKMVKLPTSYFRPQGKVMFLLVSVILFTGGGLPIGGGVMSTRGDLPGGVPGRRPPRCYFYFQSQSSINLDEGSA